ncbi:hypothetical protein [Desertivirga arenae]|uniref:hypothetical protein n=1 Tax=Desertivirga arenae TaxID=2810309 RepID=UPI001A958960|nr:hypothetical protein [Pedobacter sp. SYSU D00823]
MEFLITTEEDKEREIQAAVILAVENLSGYLAQPADLKIYFEEGERILVHLRVPVLKNAFGLLEQLYNNEMMFFKVLAAEVSEELFKYLLYNGRVAFYKFYCSFYSDVRIRFTEEVLGNNFEGVFKVGE